MHTTDDRRRGHPPLRLLTDTPAPQPGPAPGRRRPGRPRLLVGVAVALALLLAADLFLLYKRQAYAAEIERLRAGMTAFERERTDLILASSEKRSAIMLALLQRQARQDELLHLAVAVDSGRLYLERDGAILRSADVRVGPERLVGLEPDTVRLAAPRGKRTVQRVLTAADEWAVPAWVWEDRGMPPSATPGLAGALGEHAVVLEGGTVLYARPAHGPLADDAYVLPGSVRLAPADLRALAGNLKAGMAVYFY